MEVVAISNPGDKLSSFCKAGGYIQLIWKEQVMHHCGVYLLYARLFMRTYIV